MEYTTFGTTGLRVSKLCLGCMAFGSSQWRPWVLDAEESEHMIRSACEAGINFFDTADAYSDGRSEEILGKVLRELRLRDEVVVSTKVGLPLGTGPHQVGLSRKRIVRGLDDSLRRLGTNYVDILLVHRLDSGTSLEVMLEALDHVVRSGKALYIGTSSMFSWQLAKCLSISEQQGLTRFVNMQAQISLIYREDEREMLPLCESERIAVTAWSPLARGFLAGGRDKSHESPTLRTKTDGLAHRMYYHDNDFEVVTRLQEVADSRGISAAQVALAWVIRHPAVTAPLVGASNHKQLEEAIQALEVDLSPEERSALEEPYRPHKVDWGV